MISIFFIPAYSDIISYKQTAGSEVEEYSFDIYKENNGFRIKVINPPQDVEYETSPLRATLKWIYRDAGNGIDLEARNEEGRVVIKGLFKGKRVNASYKEGKSPWKQTVWFSLHSFVLSKETKTVFRVFNTLDLSFNELEARKSGTEILYIKGIPVRAVKIRLQATGLKAALWHGDIWFREEDGLYLRYEAFHGPRGFTPLTVVELTGESG